MEFRRCFVLLLVICSLCLPVGGGTINNRPIIGVMTQKSPNEVSYFGRTYLPATYVKFVESAGARVVPIMVNRTDDYYENLFQSINGLLLPGGGLDAELLSSGYGRAGKKFYDMAKMSYDKHGDVFPIWGTCQGYELLSCLAAGTLNILVSLEADDENLNLTMTTGYKDSKVLGKAPDWVVTALKNDAVAYNYHGFSVTPKDFYNCHSLNSTFNMISTSLNDENREFVAIMEGKSYPFYGVQFHPEKPIFAWPANSNIKHDKISIDVSSYFADFFIGEARKSNHTFKLPSVEADALIYNYNTTNLRGKEGLNDVYFFP